MRRCTLRFEPRCGLVAVTTSLFLITVTEAVGAADVGIFTENAILAAEGPSQEISVSARVDEETRADVHFVLQSPEGTFYEWPDWNTVLRPAIRLGFPAGFDFPETPAFNAADFPGGLQLGDWTAWLGLAEPDTLNFIAVAQSRFSVKEQAQICRDFGGKWSVTISEIDSRECGGESDWEASVEVFEESCSVSVDFVEFSKDGAAPVFGVPGSIDGNVLTVGPGDFPEGGGVTTATYELKLLSATEIAGVETWEYTLGGEVVCTEGTARITATKE